MATTTYPLRVEATLDRPLSRWLWLVKWFLAIPHFVVLFFLWVAFAVVSVAAFFAILFTGRYPRALFDFNVGVMRWTWRVSYYSYSALATDRYPPFTLREVPDYPTHLEVSYPEHLSRGLVLVKWWLLALPHYLVVGFFAGGGTWVAWQAGNNDVGWAGGGLIGILVLVAAVVLAFTGRYPQQIFDFVLGMNRWALRVAAYAGLMTDQYPPFRLDMGGHEPGGTLTVTSPQQPAPEEAAPVAPRRPGWTTGRVTALVVGVLLVLGSLGLAAGGGVALWADQTQRDAAGYLTSATHDFSSPGVAVASKGVDVRNDAPDWLTADSVVGTVRVRTTATDPGTAVFVGIGRAADVDRYLAGTRYSTVSDLADGSATYITHAGTATPAAPTAQTFWAAQSNGAGTQSLTWSVRDGSWRIVVMNADAAPGVSVRADVGAKAPALPWIAGGLLAGGVVLLAAGATFTVVAIRRAQP